VIRNAPGAIINPVTSHRWLALDGLRGVAVVVVLLFHGGLAPGGFMGVDIFFVLSGFLITRILRAEYGRTGGIRLRRFTARRLLRLYPALVAMCIFVLTVSVATRRQVPEVLHDVVLSLTYTSNLLPMQTGLLDHTWTLSLEEQFYLVWPLLLLVALSSRSAWGWLPAALVLGVVVTADILSGQSGALHTYVRAMGLPLGCALAFARPRALRTLGFAAPFTAAAFAVAVFVPMPSWLTTGWPISIGAVLAAPVVAALVTWRIAPLEWPLARWFGLRSYSLYLWHLPLMSLAVHQLPAAVPPAVRLGVGISAALFVSELSYRMVETPVLRWRDRVRPQPVADPGPSTGTAPGALSAVVEEDQL
jgi:peptidoglycan/LPS O-acetylase OafA/YrhL